MIALCRKGLLVLAAMLATLSAQAADDVASFYAGKTVTVFSPFPSAGSYGQLCVLVAKLLPKHLPGQPSAVAQFLPGAGGLRQANHMFNVAPKDGTVIGILYDSAPTAQMLEPGGDVLFDARKFKTLGSVNRGDFGLVGILRSHGVATISDAQKKESFFGATGTSAAQYFVPNAMNKTMGTKFKLIPSYQGVADQFLAMERGELHGIFTNFTIMTMQRPDWMKEQRFNWLGQLGDGRDPQFADVPLLQELVNDPVDKKAFEFFALSRVVGKVFFAPPDVPADRLAALRRAMAEVLQESEFRETVLKMDVDYNPRSWEDSEKVIVKTVETAPNVMDRIRELIKVD